MNNALQNFSGGLEIVKHGENDCCPEKLIPKDVQSLDLLMPFD